MNFWTIFVFILIVHGESSLAQGYTNRYEVSAKLIEVDSSEQKDNCCKWNSKLSSLMQHICGTIGQSAENIDGKFDQKYPKTLESIMKDIEIDIINMMKNESQKLMQWIKKELNPTIKSLKKKAEDERSRLIQIIIFPYLNTPSDCMDLLVTENYKSAENVDYTPRWVENHEEHPRFHWCTSNPLMTCLPLLPLQASALQLECRGCVINPRQVDIGDVSGTVQLVNVALNKNTDASSVYYIGGHLLLSSNAVDGIIATRFTSGQPQLHTISKEWLMIDLEAEYSVCLIKLTGIIADRIGSLKVYLSKTFSRTLLGVYDYSNYPEILAVHGNAASLSETYKVTSTITGRYVIVQREAGLKKYFDISEIEIYSPVFIHFPKHLTSLTESTLED